jgi:hypothetical protein
LTCYGVAICAGYLARSVDLAFGMDLEEQLEANATRNNTLGFVRDVGGGGLDPGSRWV